MLTITHIKIMYSCLCVFVSTIWVRDYVTCRCCEVT